MTWVRLDDHWDEHPKFLGLPDDALLAWVKGLTWSARWLQDGFIPDKHLIKLLSSRARSLKAVDDLVSVGLWHRTEGGCAIHDFLDYQPSSEKIKAERRATRDRVARFRNAKGNAVTAGVTEGVQVAYSRARADPDPDPDPDQKIPPTPHANPKSLREVACEAYGQGIRSVVDGGPFVILPAEAAALVDVIGSSPAWCGLRGDQLGQAIRKSAADYARDRGDEAKYERGLSPTKWAEWLRAPKSNGADVKPKSYDSPKPTPELRAAEAAAAAKNREKTAAALARIDAEAKAKAEAAAAKAAKGTE